MGHLASTLGRCTVGVASCGVGDNNTSFSVGGLIPISPSCVASPSVYDQHLVDDRLLCGIGCVHMAGLFEVCSYMAPDDMDLAIFGEHSAQFHGYTLHLTR